MRRVKRIAGIGSALLLAVGCAVSVISTLSRPSPALARPEDTDAADRIETPRTGADFRLPAPSGQGIAARGVIEPKSRPLKLATASSGVIDTVLVQEGDVVQPQQPLVILNSDVAAARVDAAKAELASAQIALQRARSGSQRLTISRASADLTNAKAQARQAQDRLKRLESVFDAGAVTDEELVRARLERETRAASQEAVRMRLEELRSQREEDALDARARLERARATLELEKAQLERLTMRAPLGAEVLQVKFREGEYYTPGGSEPLLVLGDTSTLRARIDIDERDIAKVRTGLRATVRAPSLPDVEFAARVDTVGRRMGRKNVRTDDPAERNDTRILEVVLTLDSTEGLVVGQRIDAFIATDATDADNNEDTQRP
ncbi:MAG: efflux RND transporter periplasmic adaptor subunit [Myxococcota bacterium]